MLLEGTVVPMRRVRLFKVVAVSVATLVSATFVIVPPAFAFTKASVPTSVAVVMNSATATTASATISWQPPANLYGAAFNSPGAYRLRLMVGGGTTSNTTAIPDQLVTARSFTLTNTAGGSPSFGPCRSYQIRIAARTRNGTQASSGTYFKTPSFVAAVPAIAPTTLGQALTGTTVALTWIAPTNTGGCPISDYIVQMSNDAGATWSTASDGVKATTGASLVLLPGSWVFRVAAITKFTTGTTCSTCAGTYPTTLFTGAYTAASSPAITIVGNQPYQPTIVSTTSVLNGVTVGFTAPTNNGGSAITSYDIEYSADGGATWSAPITSPSTATSITVSSLALGDYVFQVRATNSYGFGAWSMAVAGSPSTIPGVPLNVLADTIDSPAETATVSWDPPVLTGGGTGISSYCVTATDTSSVTVTRCGIPATPTTYNFWGLNSAKTYTFQVAAVNAAGTSAYSSASTPGVQPLQVPLAPQSVVISTSGTSIIVNWQPTTNVAMAEFADYVVTSNGTPVCYVATAPLTCTISGLTSGQTYVIAVGAEYTSGATGLALQTWAASQTITFPGPPLTLLAPAVSASTGGQVTVTWVAQTPAATPSVSSYDVQYSKDGGVTWVAFATVTTPPLSITASMPATSLGVAHIFRVNSTNSAGTGSWSANSNSVTPFDVPSTMAAPVATPGSSQATVTWTAPAANGSAITNYRVTVTSASGGTAVGVTGLFVRPTGSTALSYDFTGLTPATGYAFKVEALNSSGWGTVSALSNAVTPYSTPSAPTISSGVRVASGAIGLTLIAGATGGSALTDYDFEYSQSAGFAAGTGQLFTNGTSALLTQTVTGLTDGTPYYFHARAANVAGVSPWSGEFGPVASYGVPSAPVITSVTRSGSGAIDAVFSLPNTGGSTATDFDFEYSLDPAFSGPTFVENGTSTALAQTISGLSNGSTYYFHVRATNAAGDSPWSATSLGVTPYTTPSAPLAPVVVAGANQVTVTWVAPATNGDQITAYRVTVYNATGGSPVGATLPTSRIVSAPTLSLVFSGLTALIPYTFAVEAVNAAGYSTQSLRSVSATPFTGPSAPTILTVTRVASGAVAVVFTASAANGTPITDYDFEYSLDPTFSAPTFVENGTSTALSQTVTGLSNGSTYYFHVRSTNIAGDSSYSATSAGVVPFDVPDAPTITNTARSASASVDVTFTPPLFDGGSPVTDYDFEYSTNQAFLPGFGTLATMLASTATTQTVTGLSNGSTYYFHARAINAAGFGVWSATSSGATPYTTPLAPTLVVGTAGSSQVSVAWVTPSSTGGSPILDYRVSVFSASGAAAVGVTGGTSRVVGSLSSPFVFSGLSPLVAYTFKVEALNAAGWGPLSALSAATTPYSTPTPPSGVTATRVSSSTIRVAFVAATPNGSAVLDYDLEYDTDPTFSAPTFVENGVSTALLFDIGALTNGTLYYFHVRASNAAGDSTWSTPAASAVPFTVPDAPISVSGTAGSSQVTVTWSIATFDGGSPVSDYRVTVYDAFGNIPTGVVLPTTRIVGSAATSIAFTGLQPAIGYTFAVEASNAAGWSAQSALSTAVSPYTGPSAPSVALVTRVSGGVVDVTITPGFNGGSPITDYDLEYSTSASFAPGTGTQFSAGTTTATTLTVSNLATTSAYYFHARQTTAIGTSAWSAVSLPVTPYDLPSTMAAPVVVAGNTQGTVTFVAPSSNGSPVTDYDFEYDTDPTFSAPTFVENGTLTLLSQVISGLSNGSVYYVHVRATNQAGDSSYSPASNPFQPSTVPSNPLSVVATPGELSIGLVWVAPTSTGGSPILDYRVTVRSALGAAPTGVTLPLVRSTGSSTPSFTFTGLSANVQYSFLVEARNSVGYSTVSGLSASVAPFATPTAPSNVTGVAIGPGVISVSYLAASSPISIIDYDFEYDTDPTFSAPTFVENGSSAILTQTLSGLTNGLTYYFKVRASNVTADSPWSLASAPVAAMSPPSGVVITTVAPGASGVVGVTVTVADTGGTAVVDLDYEWSTSSTFTAGTGFFVENGTSPALFQTISGLVNGSTYYLRSRAANAAGVSAWSAVSSAVVPFSTPLIQLAPVVVAGDSLVNVSWVAPGANGSPILDYMVSVFNSTGGVPNGVSGLASRQTGSTLLSYSFAGLTPGVPYTFVVSANNAAGWSNSSPASAIVTPYTTPSAITALSATDSSTATILLGWATPATGFAPLTGFALEYSIDAGSTWVPLSTVSAGVLSYSATGLSVTDTYRFRIRSSNVAGLSPWTQSADITPASPPATPTLLVATPGDRTVTLNWAAAISTLASPVAGYTVWMDGVAISSPTATTLTVQQLTNGVSYSFTVSSRNTVGDSALSAPVSAIPFAAPSAPALVSVAVFGSATLRATWATPVVDGGSPITGYTVAYSSDGGATWVQTAISPAVHTFDGTGLSSGVSYMWKVSASNTGGDSAWSSVVSATPVDAPVLPPNIAVTAASSSADITWTPPPADPSRPPEMIQVMVNNVVRCVASITNGSCTVSGLTNGVSYTLSVRVAGAAGTSATWTGTVSPTTGPTAPPTPRLTTTNNALKLTYTFQSKGLVNPYVQAQLSADGGLTWVNSALVGASPSTVKAILFGVQHIARVRVVASGVASEWSPPSKAITPFGPPSIPVFQSAIELDKRVLLNFWVQNTGGPVITRYEIQMSSDMGATFNDTTTDLRIPATVTDLVNGTRYKFRARAWNVIGSSPWSDVTPPFRPYDSVNDSRAGVVAGDGSLHVVWSPQLSTPSRAVVAYRVYSGSTVVCTTDVVARECTVSNLPNGTPIQLSVAAVATDKGGLERVGRRTNVSGTPHLPGVLAVGGTLAVPSAPRVTVGDEQMVVAFSGGRVVPGVLAPAGHRVYVDGFLGCQIPYGNYACTAVGVDNGVPHTVVVVPYALDMEGTPSPPTVATPVDWDAPPPVAATVSVLGPDLRVSVRTPGTAGLNGYQWSRDGVVLGSTTNLVTTFVDRGIAEVAGTYTYSVRAAGGHGRLGQPATVTFTVAGVETPFVVGDSPARATVILTPALQVIPPTGSKWLVYRNGLPIKTFPIGATLTPIKLLFQPSGLYAYQVRLVTSAGSSEISVRALVDVRTL